MHSRLLERTLVTVGSAASIGFGVWHFFVPAIWDWYSYIDASATELVVAVRAINVFFSLCLVLFGAMSLLVVHVRASGRYATLVVLGASCVLWSVRVVMQLVYPQGSALASLRYGMLLTFVLVLACYAVSWLSVLAGDGRWVTPSSRGSSSARSRSRRPTLRSPRRPPTREDPRR